MTRYPALLARSLRDFLESVTAAIPRILSGLVFLGLAYVTVRVVLALVRGSVGRVYTGGRELVGNLVVTIVAVFLWFAVALTFLKIVGMGDIAASLGTAVGFVALGVSYALSEMIEDTVAAIELRKTRIDTDDGDRIVLANREIESRWTRDGSGDPDNPASGRDSECV